MNRILVSFVSISMLILISADIELGSWVLSGVWLRPIQFAYVLFQVLLILVVLYAFTRDQPEPPAAPIKERGIK